MAILRINFEDMKRQLREELLEEGLLDELKNHVDSRLDKFQESQEKAIAKVDGRVGTLTDRKDRQAREHFTAELRKVWDDLHKLHATVERLERTKTAGSDQAREALEAATAATARLDALSRALGGTGADLMP